MFVGAWTRTQLHFTTCVVHVALACLAQCPYRALILFDLLHSGHLDTFPSHKKGEKSSQTASPRHTIVTHIIITYMYIYIRNLQLRVLAHVHNEYITGT